MTYLVDSEPIELNRITPGADGFPRKFVPLQVVKLVLVHRARPPNVSGFSCAGRATARTASAANQSWAALPRTYGQPALRSSRLARVRRRRKAPCDGCACEHRKVPNPALNHITTRP